MNPPSLPLHEILRPFHFSQVGLPVPDRPTFSFQRYGTTVELMRSVWRGMLNRHWKEAEKIYNDGLRSHGFGLLKDAENAYLACLEIQPQHQPARVNLACIYGNFGEWEQSEAQLDEILKQNPSNFRAHYNLGVIKWLQDQTDEAMTRFQKTLENQPRHFWAHVCLGEIHFNRNAMDNALWHYRRALEFSPDPDPVRVRLAEIHVIEKQFDQAEALLRVNTANRPEAEQLFNLGWLLAAQEKSLEDSATAFRQAQKRKVNYLDAQINEAMVLSHAGQYEQSVACMLDFCTRTRKSDPEDQIEVLQNLIDINPENDAAQMTIAQLYYQTQQFERCLETTQRLLQAHPTHEKALVFHAQVLKETGQHALAVDVLQTLIQAHPLHLIGHLELGKIFCALKNYDAAMPVMQKILKLEPSNVETHYQYGTLLAQKGHLILAMEHYQTVAKLQPSYPRIEKRIRMLEDELEDENRPKS